MTPELASARVRSLMTGYARVVQERRWLVMLKFYIDDSGSDIREDGVFVLAGYVMEEARWEDFAEKWYVQLRRDFPIDYCRMAEAKYRDGQFREMDEVFRQMKVRDLALVIEACHPTAIACQMKWDQYNEIVKGNVNKSLDNPYAILFFQMMKSNSELQIECNKVHPFGFRPVDFIFDDQGPMTELQCLEWYLKLKEKLPEPHRTMLSNTPQFKDDRELTPLQAADMLAWHIRRVHQFPEENRDVLGLITPEDLWMREITEESLREIVAAFSR